MRATQPCGALPRSEQLAAVQTAELSKDFGIKPLSTRTEARLCVYCLVRDAGFEPATNRVGVDSSTTELKTLAPLRRARLCRFATFWVTKYNTPDVFHLSATRPNHRTLAAHQNPKILRRRTYSQSSHLPALFVTSHD